MTYYGAQCWAFVKTATNLRFPIKSDRFLTKLFSNYKDGLIDHMS